MPEKILDITKPVPENHEHVEHIKEASNYLRGTIVGGLNDPITGAIASDDTQLTKFHGSYMQDTGRDLYRSAVPGYGSHCQHAGE